MELLFSSIAVAAILITAFWYVFAPEKALDMLRRLGVAAISVPISICFASQILKQFASSIWALFALALSVVGAYLYLQRPTNSKGHERRAPRPERIPIVPGNQEEE